MGEVRNRFPLALLSAIVGTIAMILYSHRDPPYSPGREGLLILGMVSSLGITLFLSLTVIAEANAWKRERRALSGTAGIILLLGYYATLPAELNAGDVYRFLLINASLHLLVAIAPFLLQKGLVHPFWEYNKELFLRIITTLVYSVTLYVGVFIAILVSGKLFAVKVPGVVYADLWFIMIGIFNTWFFLGGVPRDSRRLDVTRDYPKVLRIFTQYILIPLVAVYFAILYLYMLKTVLQWSLPIGWVSSFVIGASMLGILTVLLIHPLRETGEHAWIRGYGRYFYFALIPLIAFMAVSIARRVMDYGVTVERYCVFFFTVWLFVIALRFSLRPKADIRFIPTSLLVFQLAVTWGPWGALAVSERSQLARLEAILEASRILIDGKIQKAPGKIAMHDAKEVSSIMDYLDQTHGLDGIRTWFGPTVDLRGMKASNIVSNQFGVQYIGRYARTDVNEFQLERQRNDKEPVVVSGYDFLYELHAWDIGPAEKTFGTIRTPKGIFTIGWNSIDGSVVVISEDRSSVALPIGEALRRLSETDGFARSALPDDMQVWIAENDAFSVKIFVDRIGGKIGDQRIDLKRFSGKFLFKIK